MVERAREPLVGEADRAAYVLTTLALCVDCRLRTRYLAARPHRVERLHDLMLLAGPRRRPARPGPTAVVVSRARALVAAECRASAGRRTTLAQYRSDSTPRRWPPSGLSGARCGTGGAEVSARPPRGGPAPARPSLLVARGPRRSGSLPVAGRRRVRRETYFGRERRRRLRGSWPIDPRRHRPVGKQQVVLLRAGIGAARRVGPPVEVVTPRIGDDRRGPGCRAPIDAVVLVNHSRCYCPGVPLSAAEWARGCCSSAVRSARWH
jgi:hypothetical protein